MAHAPSDPDADRALFEAAIAALEDGGERRMLREKAGPPAEGRAGSRGGLEARAKSARRPPRLNRRLRGGEEVRLRLDLHGLDRAAALAAVERFVRQAPRGGLALVIHGKGRGILTEAVREALDRAPQVAEHVEAPARLGGAGARVLRFRSR